jgi:hypothetical protein
VSVPADAPRAEQLDAEIRQTATVIRAAWVHLAGCLHELHRDQHWRELGYESFASYLDSIELDRGYAYKLLRVFRTLVLGHGVDPHVLEGVNADKLDIAVRKGVSDVEQVLADVRELTPKQLLARYRDELPPAPKCPTCRRALPRTGVAAKSQPRRFPLLDDRDWLAERYERMTQQEIADELGCKQVTVSQALRRHAIPTRPARLRSQAA